MSSKVKEQDISGLFGIFSGLSACVLFLIFHQITISNIWFSAPFMLFIAGLAGYMLKRSYDVLFDKYSLLSWLGYNLYYIFGLGLLCLISLLSFNPTITSTELIQTTGGAPSELILGGLPLAILVGTGLAVLITYLRQQPLAKIPITLSSFLIIFLTLGLNVSIFGYVEVDPQHNYLILKFWLMIAILGLSFAIIYIILNRLRRLISD